MMTNQSIYDAARHMLTEMVVRHVHPDSDQWLNILARRCPEATLTDREYIATRVAAIIAEWRRKPA
jgi:hypothetical protein